MKFEIITIVCVLNLIALSTQSEFKCNSEKSVLCKLDNGTTACCPVSEGTCCESGDFCCPKGNKIHFKQNLFIIENLLLFLKGFKCDLTTKRCTKDAFFIPFHIKLEKTIKETSGSEVLCPVISFFFKNI